MDANKNILDLELRARQLWVGGTGYQKISKFAAQRIKCDRLNTDFLLQTTWLEFVAPNIWLHFIDDADVETAIYSISWDTSVEAYKIGEDRDDRAILFTPVSQQLVVCCEKSTRLTILANSFQEFFECLIFYAEMVETALSIDAKACTQNRIEPSLVLNLVKRLKAMNSRLVEKSSFWAHETTRLLNQKDENYI